MVILGMERMTIHDLTLSYIFGEIGVIFWWIGKGINYLWSDKKDMLFIKNLKNKYSIIENIFIKNNAIILDKVFINYDHHAFVDGAHYNSKANEMIANEIFNKLN